jgi:AcrR family transcriptional regulator
VFTYEVPVEKLTPERRRQQTRDSLIDAAAQVFARRGYSGASLDEIAETAGFTRGAIYKNFTDKEDLFFAVFDRWNERAIEAFRQMLAPDESFTEDDFDAISRRWVEMIAGDRDIYALDLEMRLFALRDAEFRKKLAAHALRVEHLIAGLIDEQMAKAGVESNFPPDVLARVMLAASDGIRSDVFLQGADYTRYVEFLEVFTQGQMVVAPSADPA